MALRASPTSKAKQNKAVITKPRALTSAPSLDPKAQAAGTALPYQDTKTWAPIFNFTPPSGKPASKSLSSPQSPGHLGWNQLKQLVAHQGHLGVFAKDLTLLGPFSISLAALGGSHLPTFIPFFSPELVLLWDRAVPRGDSRIDKAGAN